MGQLRNGSNIQVGGGLKLCEEAYCYTVDTLNNSETPNGNNIY